MDASNWWIQTRAAFDELKATAFRVFRVDESSAHVSELSQLEERILLSATPVAVVAEAEGEETRKGTEADAAAADSASSAPASEPTDASTEAVRTVEDSLALLDQIDDRLALADTPDSVAEQDVILIDRQLDDSQLLIDAAEPNSLVLAYDGSQESASAILTRVAQWAEQSQARIGSLSILSHGTAGAFELGNQWITTSTVSDVATDWQQVSRFFSADADIYILGCDVGAADGDGQELLDRLSAITTADVFASDDVTGVGGDWILELASTGASLSDANRIGQVFSLPELRAADVSLAWYDANWRYRQTVTVQESMVNGTSDLNDFAVLVSVTDASLMNIANGGHVAQDDGGDLVFTSSDGTTKLAHEIESYDPITGTLVTWVRVPTLSHNVDTSLHLYYGNAAAVDPWNESGVWNTDYQGVWHLESDYQDSTVHNNDGTNAGTSAENSAVIEAGRKFGGSDKIRVADDDSLDITGQITVSAWLKPANLSGWQALVNKGTNYFFGVQDNMLEFGYGAYTGFASPAVLTTGNWQHVAATFDSNTDTVKLYVNGSVVHTTTSATGGGTINSNELVIGSSYWDEYLNGSLDEVRVASSIESAAAIQTQYLNQSAPATYVSLATEESPPVITAKETLDTDADGQIDHIKVTTDQNLDDDFSGLSVSVAGYTVSGYLTNIGGGGGNDNVFYISLAESGSLDSGETPDLTVTANTTLSSLSGSGEIPVDQWWDLDWLHRTKIVFDNSNSAANLTDFPLLVTLDSSNVGFAKIKAGGADIRFVDGDGSLLAHQIETWDDVNETAKVWVKVPQIDQASAADFIHLYYDNAAAADGENAAGVWPAGTGVWHLNDDPGPGGVGDIADSDATPNDGTADSSMMPDDLVAGQIGGALDFDGTDDFLDFTSTDVGDNFTIEAWIKPNSGSTGIQTVAANSSSGAFTDGYRFFINDSGTSNGVIRFETGNGSNSSTAKSVVGAIDFDQWNHVAVTVDRASGLATIYHNGVDVSATNTIRSDFNTSSDWEIGRMEGSLEFHGAIDEFRLTDTTRSADTMQASYLSQGGSFKFNNFDSEIAAPVATSDKAAATVAITRNDTNLTSADAVTFSVDFSEDVTGVDASDFVLDLADVTANATVTVGNAGDADDSTYTVTVDTVAGDGTLGLDFAGGTDITDLASNAVTTTPTTDEIYTIDNTLPTVSIIRDDANPTNANSVVFSVDFSEEVTGVDASDFVLDLAGVTANATVTVGNAGDADDSTYTVTVDTIAGDGTLGLDFAGGTDITDLASNAVTTTPTTDEIYTIDNTLPTVSFTRDDADPTNADSVVFSVDFSEDVTGVDASDFVLDLAGVTANATVTIGNAGDADASTYTVAVDTVAGDGTLGLDIAGGTDIADLAANALDPTPTADEVYTIDNTLPTVSFTRDDADPTGANLVVFSVDFSEDVTGVDASDFVLDLAGVTANATVTIGDAGDADASTYTITVDTIAGEGTLGLDIAAGTDITDLASNAVTTTPTTDEIYTIDNSVPTVSIIRDDANPTNADSVVFSVDFNEDVTGVDASDFVLDLAGVTANATVTVGNAGDADDSTYTVTVDTVAGDGTLGLDFAGGTDITDVAANALDPTPTADEVYTIDNTTPTVAITRNDANPTNADSVVFSVDFSEDVTGVDVSDFVLDLAGVTANATVTVGNAGDADASTYTVTIDTIAGDGTLGLDFASSTDITDLANNAVTTAPTTDEIYTIDNTVPTVSFTRDDADPTGANLVVFSVDFSEDVTGVDAGDFVLDLAGVTANAAVTVGNAGDADASTYTVTVDTIAGDGTLGLDIAAGTDITDVASNAVTTTPTTDEVYTIDNTLPTVSFTRDDADPTNANSVVFSVDFSEDVTGVDASDFVLDLAGVTANAAVTVGNAGDADDSTYTVTVDTIAGDGTLGLDIAGGTDITDVAANALDPTPTADEVYTIDNTTPTVAITRNDANPTNANSVVFSVDFSEDVTGVDAGDFVLDLAGVTANATVTVGNAGDADDSTYTVTVDTIAGDGTLGLDIAGGTDITDVAANALDPTPTADEVYTIDNTVPTVAITRNDPDPTNLLSVSFSVDFSEDVTGVDAADFALHLTGVSANSVVTVSDASDSDDSTYTVIVDDISGNGMLGLDLAGGNNIADLATNAVNPTPKIDEEYTAIDNTAPTVAITRNDANPTNADTVVFSVNFSEDVTGVDASDFVLDLAGVTANAAITVGNAGDADDSTYTVTVDTVAGDGTLGLDIAGGTDIADIATNALDPTPTTDELYTIDNTAPTVSITRDDANPTPATSVVFSVDFSEDVTGVDPTDFALTLSGVTANASITVGNAGDADASTYTITVDTIAGTGTLGFEVSASNNITDLFNNAVDTTPTTNEVYTAFEWNDAPLVSVPGAPLTATEGVGLNIHGAGFTVSDVDAAGAGAVATLSVGEGTIEIVVGDSGVIIADGNGTDVVRLHGTIAELDNLLTATGTGKITYHTTEAPSANTTITVTVNDQGNTGVDPGVSGDASSEEGAGSQSIQITAMNDDPTNAGVLPSNVSVSEDVISDLDLSSIELSDVDHGGGNLTVTLTTATGGRLSASSTGGVIAAGSGSDTLTLTGSLDDVNIFLDTSGAVRYLHLSPNLSGIDADQIGVTVNDHGNGGVGGGGDVDLGSIQVDITAINDAPQNSLPAAAVTDEDTPLVFSSVNGNRIEISDVDAGSNPVLVTLTASHGTLTLGSVTGLTFGSGDGTDDRSVTFVGTVAEINSALDGLQFTPDTDYVGTASVQVVVDDRGNVGVGGGLVDQDTVHITVAPRNDTPIANAEGYQIDNDAILSVNSPGLLVNDRDVDGDALTVTVISGPVHGTLIWGDDGSFTYKPDVEYSGVDTFVYAVHDGTVSSASVTATLNITAVVGAAPPSPPAQPAESETDEEPSQDDDDEKNDPIPSSTEAAAGTPAGPSAATRPTRRPETTSIVAAATVPLELSTQPEGKVEADEPAPAAAVGRSSITFHNNGSSQVPHHASANVSLGSVNRLGTASVFHDLDSMIDDLERHDYYSELVAGSSVVASGAISAGFVIWAARASYFVTMFSSSLPAWAVIDPVPVLDAQALGKLTDKRNANNDDRSLADLVEDNGQPRSPESSA